MRQGPVVVVRKVDRAAEALPGTRRDLYLVQDLGKGLVARPSRYYLPGLVEDFYLEMLPCSTLLLQNYRRSGGAVQVHARWGNCANAPGDGALSERRRERNLSEKSCGQLKEFLDIRTFLIGEQPQLSIFLRAYTEQSLKAAHLRIGAPVSIMSDAG